MKCKTVLLIMMFVAAGSLLSAQGLKVEPGTCIKVETGTTLDISGGDLFLESDATGDASLIDLGSVSYTGGGEANVERYITKDAWHLFSIPVNGLLTEIFEGDYLQSWNEENSSWSDITQLTTPLNAVQGYSLWATCQAADTTYVYSGTTLTGDQSISLSYHDQTPNKSEGMNLVGNPYPSSLLWDDLQAAYGTVYVWDPSASAGDGDYLEKTSGTIALGQAFFIYTTNDGSSFNVGNANRSHGSTFYKQGLMQQNYLVLKGSNGIYDDEINICFNPQAKNGFELDKDGWKIISQGQGISQIWTSSPDGKLAIDNRPETKTIELGFANKQTGVYSIGIKEIADIPEVYLEDTKTGSFHNLLASDYEFSWNPESDLENRFKLHFSAVGVDEAGEIENQVLMYAANGNIYIKANGFVLMDNTLIVSDVMGRIVTQQKVTGEGLIGVPVNLRTGVYLVSILQADQVITKKVFIN